MSDSDRKLGGGVFVLGGLSFIPLIGVLFGIVAIVWGLVSRKKGGKALALVGAGGIAFTVVLWVGCYYLLIFRGGMFAERVAQDRLGQLVPSIEFHKVVKGDYPTSLPQLQENVPSTPFFINDPMDVNHRDFYYERVGTDRYYLRSVGRDGQPFTADDIVPQVDDALLPKLGLLIAPPTRP